MARTTKPNESSDNTFETVVNAWYLNTQKSQGQSIKATVVFTSDERGETFSVYNPATKKQITFPFEEVSQLIDYTRDKLKSINFNKKEDTE